MLFKGDCLCILERVVLYRNKYRLEGYCFYKIGLFKFRKVFCKVEERVFGEYVENIQEVFKGYFCFYVFQGQLVLLSMEFVCCRVGNKRKIKIINCFLVVQEGGSNRKLELDV